MPGDRKENAQAGSAGAVAAYLSICLIWGSTFLAIRMAVETIPPWLMIGARCVIAGVLLGGFAWLAGGKLPRRRGLASAAASGVLLFVFGQAVLAWAETRLPSGQAGVLNATLSLFLPLASWALGTSAAPGLLAVFGLLAGFGGVVVLANPGAGITDKLACAAVVLSALAWAFGTAVARRWPPARSAGMSSGLQLLFGGLACLALSAARGEWSGFSVAAVTWHSWLGFAYLITFGSLVAFAAYGWLVQIWRPERLVTYTYINPLVALGIGVWLAGERIGLREVLAAALILSAVALVMFGNRKAKPKEKIEGKALGGSAYAPTLPPKPETPSPL